LIRPSRTPGHRYSVRGVSSSVSGGGLEPPRPLRALAPQASASAIPPPGQVVPLARGSGQRRTRLARSSGCSAPVGRVRGVQRRVVVAEGAHRPRPGQRALEAHGHHAPPAAPYPSWSVLLVGHVLSGAPPRDGPRQQVTG